MWDASGNLSGIALPELIRLIVEGEYQQNNRQYLLIAGVCGRDPLAPPFSRRIM
jgi:hypothetical protein